MEKFGAKETTVLTAKKGTAFKSYIRQLFERAG